LLPRVWQPVDPDFCETAAPSPETAAQQFQEMKKESLL